MEHNDHDAIIEDCKKYGYASILFSFYFLASFYVHSLCLLFS